MNMIEENDGERANERNERERNKEKMMTHAVEFTT